MSNVSGNQTDFLMYTQKNQVCHIRHANLLNITDTISGIARQSGMRREYHPVNLKILLMAIVCLLSLQIFSQAPVKIGWYQNPPKLYKNESGQITGFEIEIIDEIMRRLKLPYELVEGSWTEGLSRLASGQLDMMLDVAWSSERAARFAFGKEIVIGNWATIFIILGINNIGIQVKRFG